MLPEKWEIPHQAVALRLPEDTESDPKDPTIIEIQKPFKAKLKVLAILQPDDDPTSENLQFSKEWVEIIGSLPGDILVVTKDLAQAAQDKIGQQRAALHNQLRS